MVNRFTSRNWYIITKYWRNRHQGAIKMRTNIYEKALVNVLGCFILGKDPVIRNVVNKYQSIVANKSFPVTLRNDLQQNITPYVDPSLLKHFNYSFACLRFFIHALHHYGCNLCYSKHHHRRWQIHRANNDDSLIIAAWHASIWLSMLQYKWNFKWNRQARTREWLQIMDGTPFTWEAPGASEI